MSEVTTVTCDFTECQAKTSDRQTDRWLRVQEFSHYITVGGQSSGPRDFCSWDCAVKYANFNFLL